MANVDVIQCANCGRTIGKLETPRVFREEVVCANCWKLLADQESPPPPPVPLPPPPEDEVSPLEELGRQIDREMRGQESAADVRRRMSARAPAAAAPGGGGRRCPVCGSTAAPVRKSKGSTLVLILLLLLWIVPGLLYLIFFQGHVWACPTCGAKLSDAT